MRKFDTKAIIKAAVTALLTTLVICIILQNLQLKNKNVEKQSMYTYEVYRSRTELSMQGIKDDIVTEIDRYIDSIAPESCLNGIKLFELCDKYNIDVRFAMAQAQVESHFGTKGIAAKTNIVWNVRTYDNTTADEMISNGNKYSHPDHSIEPYLKLLSSDYLINGKTEEDMFIEFVNSAGNRYASNEKYEDTLLTIYNSINASTKLSMLLKEYKKYQIILG